jgi:serine/threonine protein kinase
MSPEQARGEPASAASDIYAFGLLLQELFTGRPPYPRDIDFVTLVARAARADTLPPTAATPDLAALITRLKSLAPANRPAAIEVAERLRWIRDKPRRHLRKVAVAALVLTASLGAAKYTTDLARERTAAVAHHQPVASPVRARLWCARHLTSRKLKSLSGGVRRPDVSQER